MKIKKRDNALDSRIAHIVYSYSHKLSDIEIERMIDELTEIIRKEKENERIGEILKQQSIGTKRDQ